MSPKHGRPPGPDIAPDTLAQAAAYDYEVAQADAAGDLSAEEAAARAAAEAAGNTVGGMRSTGASLGETAASAAARAAEAKDALAHTATDLGASTQQAVRGAGVGLTSAAEGAAARATAAAEAANLKVHDAQAADAGWSWEGAKGWAGDRWDQWRQRPSLWLQAAQQAAEGWREGLSWGGLEAWQERHWQAFEERQRARLAALTEEQLEGWRSWEERQRRRVGELSEEGAQLVRREMQAFEQWQQQYWAAHHPEDPVAPPRPPTNPNCRLTFLLLPLLPHPGELVRRFGRRTKMGIVGEMRETGAKLAGGLAAAGEKLGVTGRKGK